MGIYSNLKKYIDAHIKNNSTGEITGNVLNSAIKETINSVGLGSGFMGIATPGTVVDDTPDGKQFYIAFENGVYKNFGFENTDNSVYVIYNNGDGWEYKNITVGLATRVENIAESVEYAVSAAGTAAEMASGVSTRLDGVGIYNLSIVGSEPRKYYESKQDAYDSYHGMMLGVAKKPKNPIIVYTYYDGLYYNHLVEMMVGVDETDRNSWVTIFNEKNNVG